jgi:hypothetical protein
MRLSLNVHPDSRCPAVRALGVEVTRAGARLMLRYELEGDPAALVIPELSNPSRADELWKQTCFELFVRKADGRGYLEFNFAPTGQWAAYGFDDYRAGMADVAAIKAIQIGTRMTDGGYTLKAELDLGGVAGVDADAAWTFAVTAVIAAADGGRSYWALAHADGKPDFHNAAGFVAEIDSAGAT